MVTKPDNASGKPSNKKAGNCLVFYQRGGTPSPPALASLSTFLAFFSRVSTPHLQNTILQHPCTYFFPFSSPFLLPSFLLSSFISWKKCFVPINHSWVFYCPKITKQIQVVGWLEWLVQMNYIVNLALQGRVWQKCPKISF